MYHLLGIHSDKQVIMFMHIHDYISYFSFLQVIKIMSYTINKALGFISNTGATKVEFWFP